MPVLFKKNKIGFNTGVFLKKKIKKSAKKKDID